MHYITEEEFVRLIHGGVIELPFGDRGGALEVALEFDLRQAVDLVASIREDGRIDPNLDDR